MAIEFVDSAMKLVIFHGNVRLPEGNQSKSMPDWPPGSGRTSTCSAKYDMCLAGNEGMIHNH
jgi:hypothetical protein